MRQFFNPQPQTFGDLLPPPPPPPPAGCGFSDAECTQLHALCAALSLAESGSFVTTHEGTIRCISHPTSTAVMVWSTTSSDWIAGGWPP